MKEKYRLLGDFIRQVDVRNTDGKEENLLGVSVQKMFHSLHCKHGWYRLYEIQGSQTGGSLPTFQILLGVETKLVLLF